MSDQPAEPVDPVELPRPVDVRGALEEVLEALEPLEGVLIGGVALAVHGIERFTKDADLAVTPPESARAEKVFPKQSLKPLRIGGVSVATSSGVSVDLIDRRVEFADLFRAAIADSLLHGPAVRVGARVLRAVTLPWLVAMKMVADRPQDEVDIADLLRLPRLGYAETRRVVERFLGRFAARRLDRMARAAGRADAPKDYENGSEP